MFVFRPKLLCTRSALIFKLHQTRKIKVYGDKNHQLPLRINIHS